MKVAVLMGGRSEEREISLRTGAGILKALDPVKYLALAVDTGGEHPPLGNGSSSAEAAAPEISAIQSVPGTSSRQLLPAPSNLLDAFSSKHDRPDVVFMALHGKHGEDGTVQGMLELMNIPYTGSGVLASALAMDKAMSKKLFKAEEIPTPPFVVLEDPDMAPHIAEYFALPLVVKPNQQGSSYGMTIVRTLIELRPAIELALRYDRQALVEKYIDGREITAAVLGNRDPEVLPIVEIAPRREFYDFEAKYTPGNTDFFIPARITDDQAREARDYALRTHKALGCRGVSRVDMIVDDEGVWVLEINTIPGMTETSLVPKAARAAGISYEQLCDRLIDLALAEFRKEER